MQHGQGIQTPADGNGRLVGNFINGVCDGECEWSGSRPDGEVTFVGRFKNGLRSGHGTATYADGAQYQGSWADDFRSGEGVHNYANGDKYEGAWKSGKRHGLGTMTAKDGTIYHGEWSNDLRHSDKASWAGYDSVKTELGVYLKKTSRIMGPASAKVAALE